jgi:serine/threonine-protein kinase RsbT
MSRLPVMVQVANEFDVAAVVVLARRFCADMGASPVCAAHVATAASELANNLWMHSSHGGRIGLRALQSPRGAGVELLSQDDGPGIADVALALSEGYSTGGGLGCGLPGVRRLMDEFELESAPGRGTQVLARKWWRHA